MTKVTNPVETDIMLKLKQRLDTVEALRLAAARARRIRMSELASQRLNPINE